MSRSIPFNRPHITGREFERIQEAIDNRHLSSNGPFTRRCQTWLEQRVGSRRAFLTHSCTGALEMAAILSDIGPGDEVILPSFTFVSTANAIVLRRATPVFVDIHPDTLNLDENLVQRAVTPRTRMIVPVHYAGVGCDMDALCAIARRHDLLVVEDAAQGALASVNGRPLGSLGHMAAVSFHETKNVIAGEGGALLVNDDRFVARAEIVAEKGTDRSLFLRGHVDKYTWRDVGSSFQPSEITAAFLWAQFEEAERITQDRLRIWRRYHEAFAPLEAAGRVRRPIIPERCEHNAHMYYLILPTSAMRDHLIAVLNGAGVNAIFHYVPLHLADAGRQFGRTAGSLTHTEALSARLMRLPLWADLSTEDVSFVIDQVVEAVERACV
jgi:dTDP-4-amino-4,6-dideoxygalactose transaminase